MPDPNIPAQPDPNDADGPQAPDWLTGIDPPANPTPDRIVHCMRGRTWYGDADWGPQLQAIENAHNRLADVVRSLQATVTAHEQRIAELEAAKGREPL
jgi:hypothetical protein